MNFNEISIIVPTYNESSNISTLVQRIHTVCLKSNIKEEIIVVDDNSPDGTAKIAEELSKKYPVKVLLRTKDRGLSQAVVAGINLTTNDIVGVIDADLSHPPEIIPYLIEKLKDNEIVVASRYSDTGGVEEWTLIRKMISKGATLLAYPLTSVNDPMSGYFFFKKEIINSKKLKPKGYKILLEIIVRSGATKIAEYSYIFRNRELGSSKLTYKQFIEYFMQLGELYIFKLIGFFN